MKTPTHIVAPSTAAPTPPGFVELTVEESLERWLKLQGIGKKPSTQLYHREIEKIIRKQWPDLKTKVGQVGDADCVLFAERIGHFSTPRYNGCVNAIRKIIPASVYVLPRRRYVAPERHLPTLEQYNRLLTALDTSYRGHSGLAVRFLAHTGLRINEAGHLRWEHVRDDHIYCPANVTKNGRPRCVPIIKGMEEVLRALRAADGSNKEREGFILPQAKISSKTFLYACRLAGIARVSHHTFRHFYATQCILSGVDIPTVAKWLGHLDNGALLLRTYCHLLDDHSKQMAGKVEVGGLPPETKEKPEAVETNIIQFPTTPPAETPGQTPAGGAGLPVTDSALSGLAKKALA